MQVNPIDIIDHIYDVSHSIFNTIAFSNPILLYRDPRKNYKKSSRVVRDCCNGSYGCWDDNDDLYRSCFTYNNTKTNKAFMIITFE